MIGFYTHKKHQKAQKVLKVQKHNQKHKNGNKQTKIKNGLKISKWKKVTYSYNLYNGNVDPTKLVNVFSLLSKQK